MAKWYHAGAKVHGVPMQYEEACERVYGEPYGDWKKKNQKKASHSGLKSLMHFFLTKVSPSVIKSLSLPRLFILIVVYCILFLMKTSQSDYQKWIRWSYIFTCIGFVVNLLSCIQKPSDE